MAHPIVDKGKNSLSNCTFSFFCQKCLKSKIVEILRPIRLHRANKGAGIVMTMGGRDGTGLVFSIPVTVPVESVRSDRTGR